MATYKTPGVYIEEASLLPLSIAQVETAIPAFFGYTQKNSFNNTSLLRKPTQVTSLLEYESIFGKARPQHIKVNVNNDGSLNGDVFVDPLQFRLYHSLQLYFANGGGSCIIISIGVYPATILQSNVYDSHLKALQILSTEKTATIVVLADATLAGEENFYHLYKSALQQAAKSLNRFVIVDIFSKTGTDSFTTVATNFLTKMGTDNLKFGAAYYPHLQTAFIPFVDERRTKIKIDNITYTLRENDNATPAALNKSIYHSKRKLYTAIKNSIEKNKVILPPSAAIAGVYCRVDRDRAVWKAPANVSLNDILKPLMVITNAEQDQMNVDTVGGKSVNAIRLFTGKGILVWGARTLAGNDNEWRYVPVRRFCSWVEACINTGMEPFVFEPNDANTWIKIQLMIENFLTTTWRNGALQGAKPSQAFYVAIGLGKTMTATDIAQGNLIIEIGLAVTRPAEFFMIRLKLKMAT